MMQLKFVCSFCLMAMSLMASLSLACTSRSTPKPRATTPAPSTTMATTTERPNVTFPILNCPPPYAAWYCLNEATCFKVEIHNEVLYNCECANGFMGPRCEYKEIDGSYLPTRQRAMLETASIASGATLALIFMLVLCFSLYIRREKEQKLKLNESSNMVHDNAGMDEVDGITKIPEMRPFGPHHYQVLPMSSAFKR